MMLQGAGRLIVQSNGERVSKVLVYIDLDVARDSQFPFKQTQDVKVETDPRGRITIKRLNRKSHK